MSDEQNNSDNNTDASDAAGTPAVVAVNFDGFLVCVDFDKEHLPDVITGISELFPQSIEDDIEDAYRFVEGQKCLEELTMRQEVLGKLARAANEELQRLARLQELHYLDDPRDKSQEQFKEDNELYFQRVAERNQLRAEQLEQLDKSNLPAKVKQALGGRRRRSSVSDDRGTIDAALAKRRDTDRPTKI